MGLAFASADLLVEADADRRVTLCLGAGPVAGVDAAKAWTGTPLADHFDADGRTAVVAALDAMTGSARIPAIEIQVLCGDGRARRARFSAFQLPDLAPSVSCALTWIGAPCELAPPMLGAEGLIDCVRERLASSGRADMALAFVETPGLDGSDAAHQRAAQRVQAVLQSVSLDGNSAARLAPERFALLRDPADQRNVAAEVDAAARAEGLDLAAAATQVAMSADAPAHLTLKALRFALEDCIRSDGLTRPDVAFAESLKRTMDDARRFQAVVRGRQFDIMYQPIVDLEHRGAHHFEALARLDGQKGPAATIRMAEDLGLIEGFDLAVLEKVIGQLRRPGFGLTRIAANVSGASLANDAYMQAVLRQTAADPDLRRRLIVEVTETAVIADLEAADRRIAALRAAGIRVCLDDFGVGAASWDYVRRLRVDIVKIDGVFIEDVTENPRSRALIAHLVELCGDLDMRTVAERVETEAQAEALGALKVTFGQGWLFGRPAVEPVPPRIAPPATARRAGEVSGWG